MIIIMIIIDGLFEVCERTTPYNLIEHYCAYIVLVRDFNKV